MLLPLRVALFLVALAVASPAAAVTYHVAPAGNDANPGTSAAPWRTLQRAAAVMVAGDTTLVADGEYPGGIVQTRAGAAGAPITYRALNPGGAVVRGDQTAVTRCLLDNEKEAQASLVKAEGDAGRKARDIDTATGRSSAAPALAKSMRAFSEYRKAQCDYVRAMAANAPAADQAQMGCVIDITRRRVRELQ